MILDQISYLDCLVFLVFLAPQLLLRVNVVELLVCILQALPFVCEILSYKNIYLICLFADKELVIQLPYGFIRERCFTPKRSRSPFVKQASPFQDLVIRCVRYAFAHISSSIGRVFFSKSVALPFLRFRMLRQGYLKSPITWQEIDLKNSHGIWISIDPFEKPDIVIYYCHGGGFSMGSGYFYLEFLLAWVSLLKEAGYRNPVIFSLEYTLVPDAVYPTQLEQTFTGYEYVRKIIGDPSRICVAGDSAGATLMLSLLLHMAEQPDCEIRKPGYAVLISPWTTLFSTRNRNTASDYLDANQLHKYGRQYAGTEENLNNPLVSPGVCKDSIWWARASPSKDIVFCTGLKRCSALSYVILLLCGAGVVAPSVYERKVGQFMHGLLFHFFCVILRLRGRKA